MNSKDIQYLIENGLENERTKLTVLTDLKLADSVRDIILDQQHLLDYSPTKIETEDEFRSYFKTALQVLQDEKGVPFIFFDKKRNSFAGSTRFANISVKDKRVEIGWTWLGTQFQRTGLNRNNKFLMLSYAFEHCGLERVELKADGANVASCRAMEGIGATYEGALRSHTLMSDGRRRDTVYYSIIRSEWPRIKKTIFKNY